MIITLTSSLHLWRTYNFTKHIYIHCLKILPLFSEMSKLKLETGSMIFQYFWGMKGEWVLEPSPAYSLDLLQGYGSFHHYLLFLSLSSSFSLPTISHPALPFLQISMWCQVDAVTGKWFKHIQIINVHEYKSKSLNILMFFCFPL